MVRDRLQFDAVKPSGQLADALAGVKTLYLPFAEREGGGVTRFQANGCAARREKDEWDGAEPRHKALIRKLGERFPALKVEDTIVVTRDGCEVLTGAAPIELDEVEALMKQPSSFELGNL